MYATLQCYMMKLNTRNLSFCALLNLSNLSPITNNFILTYINLNIAYPQKALKTNKRQKAQQESKYT